MRAVLRDVDRRRLLLAGFLGFFALGAIQSMYGPAFPSLVRRFDVGLDLAGQTVALHFAGSFVTIAIAGPLLVTIGYRWPLLLGSAGMASGAAVVAWAPTWPWVLVGAGLGGLGFGLVDVALNLLVARSFAPHAAPALNLLNAMFGVGAVAGPAAVAVAGGTLRWPMLGVAVIAAGVAFLSARLTEPGRPAPSATAGVPWLAAGGFVVMYFLYVTGEVGVGSWETVHLAPLLGERAAALNASAYWAALTVGRILATPLSARVRPETMVLGATTLAFAALLVTHHDPLAPFAYPLVGLAFAPIFPTGLAWLQRVFPRRGETIASAVLAAATLGPVVTSGAIGWVVERGGPDWIPTLMAGTVGLLWLVVAALWRSTRRA